MKAFAPGRVNLIGDHTDYTFGLAMPMALDLGTEVTFASDPESRVIELSSSIEPDLVRLVVPVGGGVASGVACTSDELPRWGRIVAVLAELVGVGCGGKGTVTTTLPVGAGLSSSASLTVGLGLALGFSGTALELALACQQAEQAATGVKGGLLDQLAITCSEPGHGLLLDFETLGMRGVRMPKGCSVVIAHCGVTRSLVGSEYTARSNECAAAEQIIGPLRHADLHDVDRLDNPVLRKRARHVVTENRRVGEFAEARESGDLRSAGLLMNESHTSLAVDYEVSIPELDSLVASLRACPGCYGARLTGAGFGGCAVALFEREAVVLPLAGVERAWVAEASGAARLLA